MTCELCDRVTLRNRRRCIACGTMMCQSCSIRFNKRRKEYVCPDCVEKV